MDHGDPSCCNWPVLSSSIVHSMILCWLLPNCLWAMHFMIWLFRSKHYWLMQPGFYLGFIVWGRSPEWPKATSFLAGSGGMTPPENFLNEHVLRCNLVHFEKYYNVCTDLVGSGWFFRYSYLYIVIIAIFLRGKLSILRGKLLPLKYPR